METRAEHDRGRLTYGVTARGTLARPGDDVWEWRLVHERAERDRDWACLQREDLRARRYRAVLRVLAWAFSALFLWSLIRLLTR